MIDTHAHLDNEVYDNDRKGILERAFNEGIKRIVIPSIESSNFDKVLQLADSDDRIYCGIGIHPHNALEAEERSLKVISELCENEKVVAVGEIGLDYYYDFAPREVQIKTFREQISIAKEFNLPVIVHNRDADDDILKILETEQNGNLSGVLHCFSSPEKTLNKALSFGFYVSFTGNITFKNTKLKAVVEKAPIDKILLETDSPYMAPVPFRGKRNEPAYIKYIAEKIAEFKSIRIDEVIEMTTKNAAKLFRLALFFIVFLICMGNSFSQGNSTVKYNYGEEVLEGEYYNPFEKFIGFGPMIGFNTIVENYHLIEGEKKVSNEGIVAYGGSLSFCPVDFLIIDVEYVYSINKKISEQWKDSLGNSIIEPNTHQIIELSSHWIANPYGRVNVYATIGLSAIFNEYGTGMIDNPTRGTNHFGLNTGVGFYLNIDTPAGLFVPTLNWTLNFVLGRSNSTFVKKTNQEPGYILEQTQVNVFFSIPRIVLTWYPPL